MELRVLGWRYENIRGGLRNVEIDLGAGASRWTLVQMPNGTGKTTTMSLLRAAFSGENLSAQTVRDLRASDEVKQGLFEMRLAIDARPYRIQLRLNLGRKAHPCENVR
jgi:ABC-type branched-subunit amino acid transport system ATPase component